MQKQKSNQLSSNWSKTQNLSTGSQTTRLARAEWTKPTASASQKPLNSHRSIDNKVQVKKNNEHLNNSNASSIQNQQFLFNTFSTSVNQHKNQSAEQISGWSNTSSAQPTLANYSINQQNNILKNLLLQNHSTNLSQNKTLQSSGSSNSLLLDSGIRNNINVIQNAKSQSGKKEKKLINTTNLSNVSGKQVFNDIQNQLNTQSIKGKQKVDLVSVLQQFAPPQSTKSIGKSGSFKGSKTNHNSDNLKGKRNSSSQLSMKEFQTGSEGNNKESIIDKSIECESSEDINESVIVFKQSTDQTNKSEEPTPKSDTLLSYTGSIQSDEKLEINLLKKRKESRNQLHPMYLSHQITNEIPLTNQNCLSSKTSQSSSSSDSEQQLIVTDKKSSSQKKNSKRGQAKIMPSTDQAVKTPSDVFQYKLKSPNQTNLRLDSLLRASNPMVNKPSSNRQAKSKGFKKPKTSKTNQLIPKGPITQKTLIQAQLVKSESQDIFQNQKQAQGQDQLSDLDLMNVNFMFQTQQVAPPNSSNQDSPMVISTQRPSELPQNYIEVKKSIPSKQIAEMEQEFRDDSQNIKVIARFRPLNRIEQEFKDTHQKNEEIVQFFDDQKSFKIKEDFYSHSNNLQFTFDHVFQPQTTQQEIFDIVGKTTIEDIMNGYNGTIFAYGQTGSGKTFTMYGQDIFDEQLMGVVPRAARQIFNHIRTQDLEIEYQIRIQMVEIYKETLRDLLHDSPEHPPELKIKEDPKRGTYVEGLTDVCIVSEEEIMTVLCTGETMRHVASTNLNQVSSRSHSICMIEILQKFPNDSEKRGLLNLVDLAGSERVSKSNAQGLALEEAKKINYSLSMLGKVINSLTKNSPFIPYRDSKLTRLLKESLGGNNKTSLIVACSLHYSNIEETVSSLRFAQSAKFIQNKIKMNIKTSPEHLQIIIEQLKMELRTAKEEICRLRLTSTNQTSQQQNPQQCQSLEYSRQEDFIFSAQNELECQLTQQVQHSEAKAVDNKVLFEPMIALHNRPHQSLLAKNYDVIETNNQRMQMLSLLSSEFSSIPGNGTPNFISPVKNYEVKLMQLINRNEDLEMKLRSKDKDIEALKSQKEEMQTKASTYEDKILTYKQKMLILEKKVAEYESDKDFMVVNEAKQSHMLDDFHSQISVLTQQVKCLEKALEDSESNCYNLLKEKQQTYQKSIKDFLQETLKIMRIPVSEALDTFINKAKDINTIQSYINQIDLEKDYESYEKMIKNSEHSISLKDQDLLSQNLYSLELVNAVEEGSIPPEITIYLLKHLLIESSLANHNLQRIFAVNRWRQVIEFGKFKVKSELCKIQENTILTLEDVLERTRKTHDKLRARVDKLENHLYDNRNYYGDIVLMTEGNNPQQISSLTKENLNLKDLQKFNSLKDKTNQLQYNPNQSVVSVVYANCQQNPQKTRFMKTITNKTLGKAFNFIERSPLSRASIGPNQSVISQIYGQKHNTNYNKQSTPMRTGGLNSPVFYNFQSPIRRQNTYGFKLPQPQIIGTLPLQEGGVTAPNIKSENDVFTFEDAIVKFFNSNENEDKPKQRVKDCNDNGIYFLTLDDLQRIESIEQIQDVKDFIKSKFEKQANIEQPHHNHHPSTSSAAPSSQNAHNPLFVQYQNNAAFHNQTSSNLQFSSENNNMQINSNTTNNNLYAQQSNDFFDNNMPLSSAKHLPCSTSGQQYDHQRQEHVMTLASDYLITSNSVIGPNCLFSNGGPIGNGNANQYYQNNEYLDRLQEKIVQLQEEVETQKCRAEEHKKAYYESKRQIEVMRELTEDKEVKFKCILRMEIVQWENALTQVKGMNEIELQKKQREIEKLHELLAQWIDNYQELEVNKGIKPLELEKLLVEQYPSNVNHSQFRTLRHKRNKSGLLSDMMKTPHSMKNRLSTGLQTMMTFDHVYPKKLGSGISSSSLLHDQNQAALYATQQSGCPMATISGKEKNCEVKKHIQGDNSPVQQEESCFDMDQSMNMVLNSGESHIEMGSNLHTYESN